MGTCGLGFRVEVQASLPGTWGEEGRFGSPRSSWSVQNSAEETVAAMRALRRVSCQRLLRNNRKAWSSEQDQQVTISVL